MQNWRPNKSPRWRNDWIKKVLRECLFLLKPIKWIWITSTDHNNGKRPFCTPTPTCLLILVGIITFISSHMSNRIISFSIRMFLQLSPKWLWHPISKHQRQIKTPMQSLLLLVLYDMLSLWSKLALLSGIFHLKCQLNKKLQRWDKRSQFFWEGLENPPPLDFSIQNIDVAF